MVGTFSADASTSEAIDRTLADHDDIAANLRAAHDAAWANVDPAILEVCRLRIAQLLGNDAELAVRTPEAAVPDDVIHALRDWPSSPLFGASERACLAFCEQSLIDVANVTAEQTGAVADALTVQGLADFVNALLVIEQRQRLRLTWAKLFSDSSPGGSDGSSAPHPQ